MNVHAIFFDKDGTLMKFDDFWIEVSVRALKTILSNTGREDIATDEFLEAFGVSEGTADTDGLLCKGTYEQIGMAVYKILKAYGVDIKPECAVEMTIEAYEKNADCGEVKPVCDNLADVLRKLKSNGIKLAVVTTDNYKITHKCLEKLGVGDLFTRVYTDDGKTPVKPNPQCVLDFSADFGISCENIIMAGDTITDICFAKNAGIFSVCVGKNELARQYADAAIPDVSHIFEVIKGDF